MNKSNECRETAPIGPKTARFWRMMNAPLRMDAHGQWRRLPGGDRAQGGVWGFRPTSRREAVVLDLCRAAVYNFWAAHDAATKSWTG